MLMAAMAAIGGIVSAALVYGQSSPAEGERSGGNAIDRGQENYPDGSKWPAPQYEKPRTDLSFRAEEMFKKDCSRHG